MAPPVLAADVTTTISAASQSTAQQTSWFTPNIAFDFESISLSPFPQWTPHASYGNSWGLAARPFYDNLNGEFGTSGPTSAVGIRIGIAAERLRLSAFGGLAVSNGFESPTTSSYPAWTVGGSLEIALAPNWIGKAQYFYVGPYENGCAVCFTSLPIEARTSENVGLLGLTYSFSVEETPKPPQGPFPTDPRPWK